MVDEAEIKRNVREFYDQVGWQEVSDGIYQNAAHEDLRPVSRDYIHKCHMRILRHIKPSGKLLLDAGSGPIQYPEYLEYSRCYQNRVCADISIVALQEARRRIGAHGLFVVADIANLPFASGGIRRGGIDAYHPPPAIGRASESFRGALPGHGNGFEGGGGQRLEPVAVDDHFREAGGRTGTAAWS